MGRRKRIPYDPPHARKGRKGRRQGPPPRPEQVFMTRRMFLAKGAIVAAFATLAAKLGYMQVVQHQTYQAAADNSIQRAETLKATRGVIYDRRNRELAVNRRTWEVRVLPAKLPTDPGERRRVLDHLINALNLPDALVLDPTDMPAGAEPIVYARTAQLLGKVLTVEPTDQTVEQGYFTVPGRIARVNGRELQVYVYPSEAERNADWRKVRDNGKVIAGDAIDWPEPPHFAAAGNVMTFLVTPDARLAARVERAVSKLGDGSTYDGVVTLLREDGLKAWTAYIDDEIKRNYLIRLEDDLTTDLAALCRAHLNELPGVRVMNRLEYLVENGRSSEKVIVKTGVPRDVALKLEANTLHLPGVELDGGVLLRRYLGGEAMSHILGYVGMVSEAEREDEANRDEFGRRIYELDDFIGKDGLERQMEELLRGRRGSRTVVTDLAGGAGHVIPDSVVKPLPGKNLALTIDLEFQQAVSQILREGIRFSNEDRRAIAAADPNRPLKKESGAGAVVAIDPRNGEVLAMVSYPHYDNQLFVDGISQRKYDEYSSEEANKPLVDRALRGQYPPGSALKPFLAAAALHEKKIDTNKTYSCVGAIHVPFAWDEAHGNTHPCWAWRLGGHGALDVFGAIEQSCDVFFYNVGAPRQPIAEGSSVNLHYRDFNLQAKQFGEEHEFEGLGIQKIKEHLGGRFWFGDKTGIDLPAEAAGVVPDGDWLARTYPGSNWSVGDTINVSIGQGFFLTTPLQLALNTAALANGGTVHKPILVREVFDDAKREVRQSQPTVLRKFDLKPEILDIVREGMRRVVHEPKGTAHQNPDGSTKWPLTNPPNEPPIQIAGKTGTAEIGEQDEQGNYERQHAWFACFAPLEAPEIAVAVVVEDAGEGSSYAVPVADRVLRAYFEMAGKRARGKVLRADEAPLAPVESVLAESAAFPRPGATGVSGPVGQD